MRGLLTKGADKSWGGMCRAHLGRIISPSSPQANFGADRRAGVPWPSYVSSCLLTRAWGKHMRWQLGGSCLGPFLHSERYQDESTGTNPKTTNDSKHRQQGPKARAFVVHTLQNFLNQSYLSSCMFSSSCSSPKGRQAWTNCAQRTVSCLCMQGPPGRVKTRKPRISLGLYPLKLPKIGFMFHRGDLPTNGHRGANTAPPHTPQCKYSTSHGWNMPASSNMADTHRCAKMRYKYFNFGDFRNWYFRSCAIVQVL